MNNQEGGKMAIRSLRVNRQKRLSGRHWGGERVKPRFKKVPPIRERQRFPRQLKKTRPNLQYPHFPKT